jgi:hypothetical protein
LADLGGKGPAPGALAADTRAAAQTVIDRRYVDASRETTHKVEGTGKLSVDVRGVRGRHHLHLPTHVELLEQAAALGSDPGAGWRPAGDSLGGRAALSSNGTVSPRRETVQVIDLSMFSQSDHVVRLNKSLKMLDFLTFISDM